MPPHTLGTSYEQAEQIIGYQSYEDKPIAAEVNKHLIFFHLSVSHAVRLTQGGSI